MDCLRLRSSGVRLSSLAVSADFRRLCKNRRALSRQAAILSTRRRDTGNIADDRTKDGSCHGRRRLPRFAPVRPLDIGRPRRPLRRQLLHRQQGEHRASARASALRTDAARRDVPALRRGRRDLQSRLPGLADPLPARSRADDEDERPRRDQHAGAGQARSSARILQASTSRGLRRPRRSIRRPRTTGATSTRSARDPATTRASAARRRCSSTTTASTSSRSRSRGSSTPTVRACTPTTAAWCRTSSCRRCRASRITIYGDGSQTRSFCYVDDLVEGVRAADETRRRRSPARSTWAIRASSRCSNWRNWRSR